MIRYQYGRIGDDPDTTQDEAVWARTFADSVRLLGVSARVHNALIRALTHGHREGFRDEAGRLMSFTEWMEKGLALAAVHPDEHPEWALRNIGPAGEKELLAAYRKHKAAQVQAPPPVLQITPGDCHIDVRRQELAALRLLFCAIKATATCPDDYEAALHKVRLACDRGEATLASLLEPQPGSEGLSGPRI